MPHDQPDPLDHPTKTISAIDPEKEAARRAEGRYTLREAAKEIAERARGNWREIAGRLKADWASKKLQVFRPGSTATCTPSSAGLHPDYLEAHWDDLNAWLEENEQRIAWRFPRPEASLTPSGQDADGGTEEAKESPAKPLQRQRLQEREILRVLRERGYDPQNLPPYGPNQPGAKHAVRDELKRCDTAGWHGTVFDKAWGRLRANGEIRDAD